MANDLIPDDVKEFIIEKIDSVAELEALLLIYRNPETDWSVGDLAQRLYTSSEQTERVLTQLLAHDFLAVGQNPAVYRYQPKTLHLAEMVERVADVYARYLVPVTNLIHAKPQIKVQKFADAFKLRKKEDE